MATRTTNFGLYKPDSTDDFGDFLPEFNANMDEIDNHLGGGGGSSTLAGLSDVNFSSLTAGDLLIYDGAEWINHSFTEGHTILNESGTAVTARDNLQFTDGLKVTDDSGNNKTKVGVNTTFTEASTRANIASGDTFSTILGKIKKFFTDLKAVAFTGSYSDLSGTVPIANGGTGANTRLDAAKNLTNEEVTAPTHVVGLTNNWGKFGWTTLANLVTALGVVKKSGDTMTGRLDINTSGQIPLGLDRSHSSTTSQRVAFDVGNNIPDGTAGGTYGEIALFGKGAYYTTFGARDSTGNRTIGLPDKDGTVALTNDLNTKYLSVFAGRSGASIMPWTADSDMQIDLTPTCDRVSADLNTAPITNRAIFEEYNSNSANLPSANWHYVLTAQGADTNYAGQLAMGMEKTQVFYRRKSGGSWFPWESLIPPTFSVITITIGISTLSPLGESYDQDFSWSATYTIMGIAGYQLSGDKYTRCCFNRMSFRNGASKHFYYSIRNTSTTDTTGALTLTVQLLTMS